MDYISREFAIGAITKEARRKFTLADWYEFYLEGMTDAEDSLKALPAADVIERKAGKWEKYGEDMQVCSACHKYWIWATDRYDFKYCPNCGARMEGAE